MSRHYTGPHPTDLRKSLAELVTEGLLPYNVGENGGELLHLEIVTSRLHLKDGATEDEHDEAYTAALLEVLDEAVAKKRIRKRKHRRILRYILPLREDFMGTTIKERRTAAGEDLTDGRKAVKPNTIRTYYEPKALDELTRALVEMEAEHRGEAPQELAVDRW